MADWNRRRFVRASGAAATLALLPMARSSASERGDDGWRQGDLKHLVPAANHDRFVVKCSFRSPRPAPVLVIGDMRVSPRMTDSEGRYFAFDADGLKPDHTFRLTTARRKFFWQRGWFLQHQRLLAALGGQAERPGVVLSGDLHATGHVRIRRSQDIALSKPVHAILTGPLGTGVGWPSRARGTPPLVATGLEVEDVASVREKNGFALLDVDPESVTVRLFDWRRGEPEDAIDTLEPYHVHTIRRA